MELTKATKAEIDAKRVELIRDLCKGEGFDDELAVERADDLRVFGDYDLAVFFEILGRADSAMPESPFKAALGNALANQGNGKNLTERRNDFLEANGAISYRTLIRHEQEGAELLVKYFDLAESQYLKEQEEEASEDAARDADLEVMRRRLKKLEDGALLSRVADLEHIVQYQGIVIDAMTRHLIKNVSPIFEYPYADGSETIKEIQSRIDGNVARDWLTGGGLPGQPALRTPRPSR